MRRLRQPVDVFALQQLLLLLFLLPETLEAADTSGTLPLVLESVFRRRYFRRFLIFEVQQMNAALHNKIIH